MKKSLYSLTLFDEIIKEIDHLAYIQGSNRSQLINDILAEYLGLKTPEQKIKQIIKEISMKLEDTLVIKQVNDFNSIQLGNYLKYKYNPTIQYSYEFVNYNNKKCALLKISSRTKSEELIYHLNKFFDWLCSIEDKYSNEHETINYNKLKNRFTKSFYKFNLQSKDSSYCSEYLSKYIKMVDSCINYYFTHLNDPLIGKKLETIYNQYF